MDRQSQGALTIGTAWLIKSLAPYYQIIVLMEPILENHSLLMPTFTNPYYADAIFNMQIVPVLISQARISKVQIFARAT
jgi:hypothetical protein